MQENHRNTPLKEERTINLIRDQKAMYAQDYVDNNTRWSSRVTQGNHEVNSVVNSYRDIKTAQGLAADYLINWLNNRFRYLDSQWIIEGDRAYGEKEVSTVTPPQGTSAYRMEAEDAILTDFKSESPVRYNRLFASGGAYVSDMHEGSTLTFNFNMEKTATVYIYISIAKRADSYPFDDCFEVLVNGKKLSMPAREIPSTEEGEREWQRTQKQTHTVAGYKCQRATTTIDGVRYEAWYSDALPHLQKDAQASDCGRGLILEAHSADSRYTLRATYIEQRIG